MPFMKKVVILKALIWISNGDEQQLGVDWSYQLTTSAQQIKICYERKDEEQEAEDATRIFKSFWKKTL